MKKLPFKLVALVLVATSALMYAGCYKKTGSDLPNGDHSALRGGTWVLTKSIVDYYDDAGKLIYTEDIDIESAPRYRFSERFVSIATTDANGYVDNKLYDFVHNIPLHTEAQRYNPSIHFYKYPGGQTEIEVYIGTGSTSNVKYTACYVDYTTLTDTDLTLRSDQRRHRREFTPKGTTTKIQAARSYITFYYKKQKQIGD